mmetsp:Transcript_28475/g.43697  ORF Transcript_28475/g.43697 Transcript_28475/m.43697 type:complete len:107 (-) Transcript_28475:1395-1715(-)
METVLPFQELPSSSYTSPTRKKYGLILPSVMATPTTMDAPFLPCRLAAAPLKSQLKEANMSLPKVGIVCGSGLSELSKGKNDHSVNTTIFGPPGSGAYIPSVHCNT